MKNLIDLLMGVIRILFYPQRSISSANIDRGLLTHEIISLWAKKVKGFFFIQIRSGDGIKDDPICRYIKKYHWPGILIEPKTSPGLKAFRKEDAAEALSS